MRSIAVHDGRELDEDREQDPAESGIADNDGLQEQIGPSGLATWRVRLGAINARPDADASH
jgi:hypothetical protein